MSAARLETVRCGKGKSPPKRFRSTSAIRISVSDSLTRICRPGRLRSQRRPEVRLGHVAHINHRELQVRRAEPVVAAPEVQHHQDTLGPRVRAESGSENEPRVQHHQVPAGLFSGHLPRQPLRERLRVRIGLVALAAGRVPVVLVKAVAVDPLEVRGVPVDCDDAGGEHDPPHRRRAVGGFEDVARPGGRRFDEITDRIPDAAHDERRGDVEDETTPPASGHRTRRDRRGPPGRRRASRASPGRARPASRSSGDHRDRAPSRGRRGPARGAV